MSDTTLSEPEALSLQPVTAFCLATSVQAGLPSPAADFAAKRIDVMDRLVVQPQATYSMRVSGESMREPPAATRSAPLMATQTAPPWPR